MKSSKSPSRTTVLVMGRNSVAEVLKHQPERVKRIFTSRDPEKEPLIEKSGKPVREMSDQALTGLLKTDSHQGLAAELRAREHPSLKDVVDGAGERSFILLLDSIFDPHNFGAILRAAECFGADAVVFSKNRGASITPVVTKVSVGASELVPISVVSNLAESVRFLQNEGYHVSCADVGEGAVEVNSFSFPDKFALVLGSEGKGIQPLIRKRVDSALYLPMKGHIDSLNVSQAAALFCSLWSTR